MRGTNYGFRIADCGLRPSRCLNPQFAIRNLKSKMEILIVGLSHKTAPLDIRETISFSEKNMDEGVRALVECPSVSEGLIISTCNRVEVYSATPKKRIEEAKDEITQFLADFHDVPREQLDPHMYNMTGEECVGHIFRVASSLDSMVVGEPQILGQVKEAFGCAANAQATGNILNRLLHKAFSVAKRVRSETRIATSAVSISFAAVELAKKIFGELEGKPVMLIGAGEMAELAARHLLNNGVEHIIVSNRTYENAVKLAEEFKGTAVPFDELGQQMELAQKYGITDYPSPAGGCVLTDPALGKRIERFYQEHQLYLLFF